MTAPIHEYRQHPTDHCPPDHCCAVPVAHIGCSLFDDRVPGTRNTQLHQHCGLPDLRSRTTTAKNETTSSGWTLKTVRQLPESRPETVTHLPESHCQA